LKSITVAIYGKCSIYLAGPEKGTTKIEIRKIFKKIKLFPIILIVYIKT